MTNEEIIRNTDIGLDLESSQIALYPVEIKKILNLARKDERNKVIEEIFDFVFNYDMELHVMNDILAKLNQLKNP